MRYRLISKNESDSTGGVKMRDEILKLIVEDIKWRKDNIRKRNIKYLFIMGIIYVIISGIIVFGEIPFDKVNIDRIQIIVLAIELFLIGMYAIFYSGLFFIELKIIESENSGKKGQVILKILVQVLLVLISPYYYCAKFLKNIIKNIRQQHVMQLLPNYLISLLAVLFFLVVIYSSDKYLIKIKYLEGICFALDLVLLAIFYGSGKILSKAMLKSIIRSTQKYEIKRVSKNNWRNVFKDEIHRKERKDRFNKEWKRVEEELEYTKIYFYIVLSILLLCFPKNDSKVIQIMMEQFLGIISIAALSREVRSKKKMRNLKKIRKLKYT